eukprot:15362933-Heterocapsa_arctica.AAC.1
MVAPALPGADAGCTGATCPCRLTAFAIALFGRGFRPPCIPKSRGPGITVGLVGGLAFLIAVRT